MKDKISIIIPVYNAIKWLSVCIESILNQTYTNFEVLMIDDGSTDGSSELCDRLNSSDERIIVRHQENKGVSCARNHGLDILTGDYITFINADDHVDPKYLMHMYNLLIKYDCEVVQCRHMRPNSHNADEFGIIKDDVIVYDAKAMHWGLAGVGRTRSMLWCKMYKRRLFNQIRFPDGMIHEDEAVMHKVLYSTDKMVTTMTMLYHYRTSPESIMNREFNKSRYDALPILKERLEFYKEKGWSKLAYASSQRYAMTLIDYYRKTMECFPDSKDILDNLISEYKVVWEYLKYSPILNKESRELHTLWAKDPMAGELYNIFVCFAEYNLI